MALLLLRRRRQPHRPAHPRGLALKIRAHHLLCLATFRGEGYSPAFIARMWSLWRHAREGGTAELIAGMDDLCAACPSTISTSCRAETRDRRLLDLLGWTEGEVISVADRVRALLPERARWTAEVCAECPWIAVCRRLPAAF